jgi:hypothetical protein
MKRIHIIIYFLLLAATSQVGCSKADGAKAPTTGAGGSLARFAITGNYLYMVDYSLLTVIDITDPTKPVKKGDAIHVGGDVETIFPYKNKLFIGGMQGMYIYSIDNPAAPKKEGSISHFRACDPVVANDSVSYVTLRNFGTGPCSVAGKSVLNVYDVKTLSTPKLVTTIDMKGPYGLGIMDKTLYVCEGSQGIVVFDLADPYKPAKKKEITGEFFTDVIPYGNVLIAYISGGVSFYDISDPQNPVFLSTVKG